MKAQIKAITEKKQEEAKAEIESGKETGPTVQESDIADVVAAWTGIPVDKVASDEAPTIDGHGRKVTRTFDWSRRSHRGVFESYPKSENWVKSPNRPVASFIFAGPTGVGKSELAKSLSQFYFGSEDAMVRLICLNIWSDTLFPN